MAANAIDATSKRAPRRHLAVWGCANDGRLGLGLTTPNPLLLASSSQQKKPQQTNPNNSYHQPTPVISSFFYDLVSRASGGTSAASSSSPAEILSVHVGGYHTFVRTTDGVYGFGLNEQGQLGANAKHTPHYPSPIRIAFFDEFDSSDLIDIACGSYHSVAWLKQGIFVCGSNEFGQLGLSPASADAVTSFTKVEQLGIRSPEQLTNNPTIGSATSGGSDSRQVVTHISAGTSHTLIALQNVFLPTRSSREQRQSPNWDGQEQIAFYPAAVVAAGKGDYGELGYDPDAWDCLAAQEKRIQRQVQHQAQYVQRGGNAADIPTSPNNNNSSTQVGSGSLQRTGSARKKTGPPPIVRRPEFSSATFRVVELRELDDVADRLLRDVDDDSGSSSSAPPQRLVVTGLKAMHLRSAVRLQPIHQVQNISPQPPPAATWFTFGCSYCDGVETMTTSVPRPFCSSDLKEVIGRHNHPHFDAAWPKRVAEYQSQSVVWNQPEDVVDLHAGEEALFLRLNQQQKNPPDRGSDISPSAAAVNGTEGGVEHTPKPVAGGKTSQFPLLVMGKGHLGLTDDEEGSYEVMPQFFDLRPLSMPQPQQQPRTLEVSKSQQQQQTRCSMTKHCGGAPVVELRSMSGRSHYLFHTIGEEEEKDEEGQVDGGLPHSETKRRRRDVVYGFGDNLFGQVGGGGQEKDGEEGERVARPRVVIRSAWHSKKKEKKDGVHPTAAVAVVENAEAQSQQQQQQQEEVSTTVEEGEDDGDEQPSRLLVLHRAGAAVRVGRVISVHCGARHSVALIEEVNDDETQ